MTFSNIYSNGVPRQIMRGVVALKPKTGRLLKSRSSRPTWATEENSIFKEWNRIS